VADLKDQTKRVCPLTCAHGEHPEGDRCIANVQPEKTEKPKATARDQDEEKASSRAKAKREQAKREEMKQERRRDTARSKPERAQPERAASRPQPAARSQAFSAPVSIPRHSGGSIVGVGF